MKFYQLNVVEQIKNILQNKQHTLSNGFESLETIKAMNKLILSESVVMSEEKLAINGGQKLLTNLLRGYNSIGNEEVIAAKKVIETGCPFSAFWVVGIPTFMEDLKFRNLKEIVKNTLTSNML